MQIMPWKVLTDRLKCIKPSEKLKGLSEFKERALEIVEECSREYATNTKAAFENVVPVSDKMKLNGLEYAKSKKMFHMEHESGAYTFYVVAGDEKFDISKDQVDEFKMTKWNDFENLEEFLLAVNQIYAIKFPENVADWINAQCGCPALIKLYMCKHILAVAFRIKVLVPQMVQPEGLKAKKGADRPKKTSKGLSLE